MEPIARCSSDAADGFEQQSREDHQKWQREDFA
jgi:hypothetical protein